MEITFEQAKVMWKDLRYFYTQGSWKDGKRPVWLADYESEFRCSYRFAKSIAEEDVILAFAKELGLET